MPGELRDGKVVVPTQSEANRIHNKGRFGRPLSGGALELDLVEAAFLAETGRLEMTRGGVPLSWADVVIEGSQRVASFEILYLAYREYRERGVLVAPASPKETEWGAHFRFWDRGTEKPGRPMGWVRALSERSVCAFPVVWRFASAARDAGGLARLSLVDEESDLTHYELGGDPPKGQVEPDSVARGSAQLLADRVLVADAREAERLHGREFYGKPVGKGLQLSLVEAVHLQMEGRLDVTDPGTGKVLASNALRKRGRQIEPQLDLRLSVYADLKARGLVVKTGFKFGTHFRAYEARPEEGHAPYLIQAVPPDFESPWEPLARAIRLSHTVRKRFYLAAPDKGGVRYISFGRFRV